MRSWILLLLTAGASLGAFWDRNAPRELGEVRWERVKVDTIREEA